ncbi:MAG: rod-binding protein [Silicimonas sp.]|jgi:Rod binding domain-containing protein|nr:rod-binding protein [Silicimonas sp.]
MTPLSPVSRPNFNTVDPVLKDLADKIESQFLAEMLKSAGLGDTRESFGGGVGEAQFSSFLTAEFAKAAVAAGGIGLSEAIYNSLVTRKDAT